MKKPLSKPAHVRTDARRSKIDCLPKAVRAALVRWLTVEKVTYAEAQRRLESLYQVPISLDSLCRFWQRHLAGAPAVPAASDILLDVVIQSSRPVRLIVKRRGTGIRLIQKH